MTDFNTHTIGTAPESTKPMLEAALGKYGFLPNLLGKMAESPAMLKSYMTLNQIFGETDLNETERQIILMTNNLLNGCDYCMAAHTSISQMAEVPEDVIEALRNNKPLADTKLEALRTFSKVINETRGYPSQEQIDAFLSAGYTNEAILDVIIGTSLKVLSNYTNHITKTELDKAFEPNKWSKNT